ncbi:hypothetical protein XENORESO_002670, partial [Xenotaenia resolanae]
LNNDGGDASNFIESLWRQKTEAAAASLHRCSVRGNKEVRSRQTPSCFSARTSLFGEQMLTHRRRCF